MQKVFGIPAGALTWALTIVLVVAAGAVTVLALRNIVFLKMGARNIGRRRARSALIVVGLMLGTAIISSALLTGDTMGHTVRASVIESLGLTDERVTAAGSVSELDLPGVTVATPYFETERAVAAVERAARIVPIDGYAPAIVEPIAAQSVASRQTEPRLTLFASDPALAASLGLGDLADLGAGQVLLDEDAARELRAGPGDALMLLAGERSLQVTVHAVGDYHGTGVDGSAALMPLDGAQALLGRAGLVNQVLVSNEGGETSGAALTDEVRRVLEGALAPMKLESEPVKADGLDLADAQGNSFMQLFTTFGSFSMAAGILLIFLIFVMLAAERRSEMGMIRAVGIQRRHLVQTFLFEGAIYDLLAAAVGALLGIGVSFVMVRVTARAFAGDGFDLQYSFSMRSLVIGYALGVLLTLLVVSASAWRVSRLNIVSAVRDIPEPAEHGGHRRRWLFTIAGLVLGTLMAISSASSNQFTGWMVGVSLVFMSLVPLVRGFGLGERAAFSLAGGALVVWWLLPLDVFESALGPMKMDFGVWTAGGILLVIGATWLITYNADILLGRLSSITSRFASVAPVMKMAVTYPLRSRFRTGVTLAMFTLVVFTLVTGTTISMAFINAFNDVDTFGGGFDVRASTAPALSVSDLRDELPPSMQADVRAIGAQSLVPVQARQDVEDATFEPYPLRGVDREFTDTTTYGFASIATGYASAADVWHALQTRPGTAVVDSVVVPRRQMWAAGVLPDFRLSGLYLEDPTFDPIPVTVRDTQTGRDLNLTIIGVLNDRVPFEMAGITVSQQLVAPFGELARPTVHHVALEPGADAGAFARELESALLSRGVEAETYSALLSDAVGGSLLFNRLIQGFMGLGLLVGVAALGVISARAVVERRQQLGVLRAIGFQPEMIRRALLLESSFVSLTAIVVGTALGLGMSYNVVSDAAQQQNAAGVQFGVPWLNLIVVFVAVYLAALATTLAPAVRASRVYPAEALRYQ